LEGLALLHSFGKEPHLKKKKRPREKKNTIALGLGVLAGNHQLGKHA